MVISSCASIPGAPDDRGEEFKKLTYGNLGRLEVEDQISTARYMARQSYVDPARIGIYGWSYGGFMAWDALSGAKVFSKWRSP